MASLRAALIGLGAMGKNHARVLKSLPGVDLVAVFDPAVAEGSLEVPLVSSFEELISLKPDYCVIATPTFTHEELAIKLASKGINIFIEKPISVSADSASRIIAAVTEKGLIGGVGHIERFNAALVEAKRRINLGELGDVYQISTRRLGPFPARITDVGVTIDLATHDIDLTNLYYNLKRFKVINKEKIEISDSQSKKKKSLLNNENNKFQINKTYLKIIDKIDELLR